MLREAKYDRMNDIDSLAQWLSKLEIFGLNPKKYQGTEKRK